MFTISDKMIKHQTLKYIGTYNTFICIDQAFNCLSNKSHKLVYLPTVFFKIRKY